MRHRRALLELYQCTKFGVTPSKFSESKGVYAGTVRELFYRTQLNELKRSPCPIVGQYGIELN